ncbi:MAG: alkaline phosphatase family protein, partial [Calditrichaeota bacterium]
MDGLGPDYYLEAKQRGVSLPTLTALMRRGVYATGMQSIYPSITYPAHASMVTGVVPRKHGIYSNAYYFDGQRQPVISGKAYLVAPIWRAMRQAGLHTGSVFWPVTAEEPIDWCLPEAWWDADKGHDEIRLRKEAAISTPGLLDSLRHHLGPTLDHYFESDTVKTDAAIYILKKYRPNLLLLHYSHLDYIQHVYGPFTPRAFETLQMQDTQIGRLIEAAKQAHIFKQTVFMIVSDHGHAQIRWLLHPGPLLVRAGLIRLDSAGQPVEWQAMVNPTGGSCAIILKNPADQHLRRKVVNVFRHAPAELVRGIERQFSGQQLDSLGIDPHAVLVLEAKAGYAFGGHLQGKLLEAAQGYHSTHGYLPDKPQM